MDDFDSEKCHLKQLSKDLLADVMSRLDGLSLAAAACTCTELHDLATETGLWEDLCHTTWPSTASPVVKDLVPFDKFYAESHPLILYDGFVAVSETESFSDSFAENLVFLVDVFYKGVCVFSKVVDGVPEAGNGDGENHKWFADWPFELNVIKFDYSQGLEVNDLTEEEEVVTNDEEIVKDFSQEFEKNVRLSWVILNKKSRKSVNVSSWKPQNVQKSWMSSKNYTFQFGCAVSVESKISAQGAAECVITAKCERSDRDGLKWDEIGMSIKDMSGAHLGGKRSLTVLNRAILSTRSNHMEDVRKGYARFEKMKTEMKRASDCKETIANGLCLSVEIVIFVALYHTLFW